MKKPFFLAFPVLLPLMFYSCVAPKSIVKLNPTDGSTKWTYGQEFAMDSVHGIICATGFDQVADAYYLFDFDITNRSNLSLLIDPKDFFYIAYDENMQPLSEDHVYAKDPEATLLELEKNLSLTESRRKNNLALSLFAIGADVATSAIANSNHRRHYYVAPNTFWMVQEANRLNEYEASDLKQLHESWSHSTIRKTTLDPSFCMKGKVFFPISDKAKYIELYIPVDESFVKIKFRQDFISPKG